MAVRSLRIRVRYRSLADVVAFVILACALSVPAGYSALGYSRGPQPPRAASLATAAQTTLGEYYLTPTYHNGSEAAGACADHFHMASLWELFDPSNLRYRSDLGYVRDDSGQGPPSFSGGWIRTGYAAGGTGVVGEANCTAWSSADGGSSGTYAYLASDWSNGGDVGVWKFLSVGCGFSGQVWCVSDDPLVFADGFETGATSRWTSAQP